MKRVWLLMAGVIAVASTALAVGLSTNIQEGSSPFLKVTFLDENGLAGAPNVATFWVNHRDTHRELVAPQSCATPPACDPWPASTTTLNPTTAATTIDNEASEGETHVISVTFAHPSGCTTACKWGTQSFEFYVVNNPFLVTGGASPGPSAAPTRTSTPSSTPTATRTSTRTP